MRFVFVLLIASVCLIATASNPEAQTAQQMAGTWYGENPVSKAPDGNPADIRRWLRVMRADWTTTITIRFYSNGAMIWEQVRVDEWGLVGATYWTQCKEVRTQGQPANCTGRRNEYDVHSLTADEMIYTPRVGDNTRYRVTRVPSHYRLP